MEELRMDLFKTGADALVNTVNTVGIMGKGIALSFKQKYPNMFRAYRTACSKGELTPGRVWVYKTAIPRPKYIFNAAVKQDWKNPSKIEWVESCLNEIILISRELGIKSVALPWMGALNGRIPVEQIKDSTRRILQPVQDIEFLVCEIRDI